MSDNKTNTLLELESSLAAEEQPLSPPEELMLDLFIEEAINQLKSGQEQANLEIQNG